jgi:hypothetical protein
VSWIRGIQEQLLFSGYGELFITVRIGAHNNSVILLALFEINLYFLG